MTNDDYDKLLTKQGAKAFEVASPREVMNADQCIEQMTVCLAYLDDMAMMVSNIRKPRTDNTYGRAAQLLDDSLQMLRSIGLPVMSAVDDMAKTYPGEAAIRQALDHENGGSS